MMNRQPQCILPDWPAPANVKALQTTRQGGVSRGPYASLNLGEFVADDPLALAINRQRLAPWLPSEPVWIKQVHGVDVIDAAAAPCAPVADAVISTQRHAVCAITTADCLPVLLCDRAGTVVAAVHAGWKGLADGAIEAAVARMAVPVEMLMAWLGPAIGPQAFEVGGEVRDTFIARQPEAVNAFVPVTGSTPGPAGQKWLGDLYQLARLRLERLGISQVTGGGITQSFCTYSEPERFFSYRRDVVTGRMASLIWLD